jgi:hypothetical protein
MANYYPLEATALIEHDGDEYIVWLCHDNPQDHPHNHSFAAGSFETFDAAVAALLAVRGLKIYPILSGSKSGDSAETVEATT